ncbi:unnamed protein product [Adineta steineri]|uniref:Uncharacterized protein n=2 Tax=Adineta steineri TaxID=433720 RepID=A0A815WES9_9BILA|nr:unnamed protein product [Adineta steineri]CAF4216558.1 unnamed protein product [Adineta steineri]
MGQRQSTTIAPQVMPETNLPVKTLKFENNSTYTGQVNEKNEKHGHGKLIVPGKLEYIGQFQNGNMHGFGKMIHTNGTEYEGEYKHNRWDGHGKLKYPNWQIYRGEFQDGLRHGHGVLYNSDGTARRSGQWKYGEASHCCGLC